VFDVAADAPQVRVLDVLGRLVMVDARHAMSADPVSVCINDDIYDVIAWAGPWPVEERWWDSRRARRAVRLQLLVRQRDGRRGDASRVRATASRAVTSQSAASRAMVVVLERRTWRLAALYA
jgi:hypothetical protein